MAHLDGCLTPAAPLALVLLVVLFGIAFGLFALEPRLEKFRWVEVVLHIANDLSGAYGGWLVDSSVPKTPSRTGPEAIVEVFGIDTGADGVEE